MDMNKLMKTYANEISAGSISVVGSDDTTVTIELNSTIPMEEGQKVLPELHIPQYIPEGYEYNGLNIQKAADGTYGATYNFTFNKNELIFKQMYRSGDAGSIVNLGLTLEMESGHGNLYYGEDGLTNINQMVLIENSGIRYIIYGTFEKEELKKMMESFELKPQK